MTIFEMSPRFVACTLAAFCVSACVVNSSPSPGPAPPASGTLSVLSSIESSTQPSRCDAVGATDLEVAVFLGSSHYTTATSSCSDFQLTVALPDDDYNADVTLLNGHAIAVSTTLPLNNLSVISGTDLKVDIDFPSSSILP